MTEQSGPVDAYLDRLFDRLSGTGPAGRRTLAEAEDHLRAAAGDGEALGLDRAAAERRAIEAFGSPDLLAAQVRAVHRPAAWLRPAFTGAWLAGGVALITVGVAGLVAEVMGRIWGPAFVAGDTPGVTYTAARCAQYLAISPRAHGCAEAAATDHWGEVVMSRVGAGVLGLIALMVLWAAVRTTALGTASWRPPRGTVALPLMVLFALAGLGLSGLALMQLAFRDTGMMGANLSAGVVALVAAVICGIGYARRRSPAPGRAG